MEIPTKENIKIIDLMDTELIPGKKMRRFMKETSKMD
jgi:hypothetical protein